MKHLKIKKIISKSLKRYQLYHNSQQINQTKVELSETNQKHKKRIFRQKNKSIKTNNLFMIKNQNKQPQKEKYYPIFQIEQHVGKNDCTKKLQKFRQKEQNCEKEISNVFNADNYQKIWDQKIDEVDFLAYIEFCKHLQVSKKNHFIFEKSKHFLLKAKMLERQLSFDEISQLNVSFQQAEILKIRASLMENFYHKQQNKELNNKIILQLSPITVQLGILCNILQKNSRIILQSLKNLSSQIQKQKRKENINENLTMQHYLALIITKNLKIAFENKEVDLVNYFKRSEYQGQGQNFYLSDNNLIKNYNQWKKFIQARRYRKDHQFAPYLHTNCSACFSNYVQLFNPFHYCNKCQKSTHKNCINIKQECHYCCYQKLSREAKLITQECFICGLSGIMITKISKNLYIHNFCMFVHKMYKISQQKLQYDHKSIERFNGPFLKCYECNKNTLFSLLCDKCGKNLHASCAYLSGCHLEITKNEIICVNCCVEGKLQNARTRKYTLNYEKTVHSKQISALIKLQFENPQIN